VRQLVAALGLAWALGSLYAAWLFEAGGLAGKTAHKGLEQQALLLVGGLLIGPFAVLLIKQCLGASVPRCLGFALSRESESGLDLP